MICISVTPASRKLARADILNASRHGDLIELCLDRLVKEPDVGELIHGFDKPILISCRRKVDGGQWDGSEEERLKLLRRAIAAGPAYVELELDVAPAIPRFGSTRRVISYTSYQPLGSDLEAIFTEAARSQADVVKFTWPTPTLDAAWPLLAAVSKERTIPVVGMGIGRPGVTFALLGLKYGSPWVYAALEKGMEAYDGQPTVWELDELYDWIHIAPRTRLVGVVGFGPAETATLRALNAGFKLARLDVRCLPLELGRLDRLDRMLDVLKIRTLLVNPAWSARLLEFAAEVEDAAARIRSADLLLKQPEGWRAYNLLWRTAVRSLEAALGGETEDDRPLEGRNVMLIGANATARALAHGILRRQGLLSVTAPDDDEARKLAREFRIRHVPFQALYDTLADAVVMADPAVTAGHRKTQLSPAFLRPPLTVMDLCHPPAESELLEEARVRGCRIVEPAAVYAEHVAARFKSITGQDMPREAVARALAQG